MGIVGQAAGAAAQGTAQVAANQASTSGRVNIDVDAMKQEVQEATGGTGAQSAQQQGVSEQKAREAGDTAARATAGAALWSFVLLALGAGVAAYGGASGRRDGPETGRFEAEPA